MANAVTIANNYFTQVNPRDFFNAIRNISYFAEQVLWHFMGKTAKSLSATTKVCGNIFDGFSGPVDLTNNLDRIKNWLLGRKIRELDLLPSDTANSVCETASWLSAVGILSLSSNALNWFTAGSGLTLIISFLKRTYNEIENIIKKPLTNAEKKVKMFAIARNVALVAMGVMLFATGWFGNPLNVFLLTVFGSVTIISNLAIYLIRRPHKSIF